MLGDPDPERPLIVAEGIETALSASQLAGVPAIATLGNNMPAVNPPECSEVIIAPDNDDAGRKEAHELAQRLVLEGRTVRIAPPPKPDNDWNDTLRNSADADRPYGDLRGSILNAKQVEPPRQVQALPMGTFMTLQFPPRQYLIKPWLETSALVMIAAQRGDGKTLFSLSAAHAVATGPTDFMDWPVERRGRALYVDGELPGSLLQDRLSKLGPIAPDLLVLSRDQFNKAREYMPDLATPEYRTESVPAAAGQGFAAASP